MANYVGIKCPVCNKRFAAVDDIVVCPVCGAPHHRNCYAETGNCAYVGDHICGKEWRPPQAERTEEEQEGSGTMQCPRCGSQNPCLTLFCQICGAPMTQKGESGGTQGVDSASPFGDPFGGIAKDETIGGMPVSDMMFYVGPNSAYYIPRFYGFEKLGNKATFNFPALILNFFYFFYRKMYAVGIVLFLMFALGMIPTFLYLKEVFPQALYEYGLGPPAIINEDVAAFYYSIMNAISWINLMVRITLSFFATRIYYNKAIREVADITGASGEGSGPRADDYHQRLIKSGGVDRLSVVLIVAIVIVAFFLITSALTYYVM